MLDEFGNMGVRNSLVERVPLGEESDPIEIARLVLFLASEDSRHATGAEFVLDGGMTA